MRERPHHLLVERLAHAVQALEFVLPGIVVAAGHLHHRRHRVRVVRGELRVHGVGRRQQQARAGQVGEIGVGLARIDRIALQAVDLRALDLAVPVGALDQPHHQPAPAAACQVDEVLDHVRAALLVGLRHEADAVPALECRLEAQALEQVERELESIGFLGIDVQADVVLARQPRQPAQARIELLHDALALRAGVARMQRRELDRDARPLVDAAAGAGGADGADRLLIGREIALRVLVGERRLAEHVVGVAKALRLAPARAAERLRDGLAAHELLAQQPHGHVERLAHHRLAAARERATQRTGQPRLVVCGDQPAGDDQAPGGGVDEERPGRSAEVRAPVGAGDLVADQRVARGRVRDAQQRLGQAHQRHALLRRQRELVHQPLHQAVAQPRAGAALAQALREPARQRIGLARLCGGKTRRLEQCRDAFRLGAPAGG